MTWLDIAPDHPFGVANLPYGAFNGDQLGVRIGDHVLNLTEAERRGLVNAGGAFATGRLNEFMAQGRPQWRNVRGAITELLRDASRRHAVQPLLVPLADAEPRLPFDIGDYVDFYSSEHHASNVGKILRPTQPPLLPNWKHLPVAYHGRAGTVVVSGTEIVRPSGQYRPPDADAPAFGPTTRLDIEAEVGFVVGIGSRAGQPLSTRDFEQHVFGVVLVNDWSARDIQAWEYQPLGPFLAKSFATSISAWVVPLDALRAARVPAPRQDPPVLPYLRDDRIGYDITLEVRWNNTVVSRPPFADMYWTPAQQLAHLTVNGARVRTGDLYASGTVSGPHAAQTGSFLELTWNATRPVRLVDGTTRTFLADGDTATISAAAPGPDGAVIGFGDVVGTVTSAFGGRS